jgi:hypothetical protein
MTTFTVTDCSTDIQLQYAISHASDGDMITFACSGTITLTRGFCQQASPKGRGVANAHIELDL